jgi:hypothetical protein
VQHLKKANKAVSKRRRAKQTHLQDTEGVAGSEARDIMAEKGVGEEDRHDEEENGGSSKRRRTGSRHCGVCRKAGHNARTCPEAREIDSSEESEIVLIDCSSFGGLLTVCSGEVRKSVSLDDEPRYI